MNDTPFRVAPLAAVHDRVSFNSGAEPLNRYLREQVTQDVRRRVAACLVALAEGERIVGYYTLASASVLLAELPTRIGNKLPRYRSVPAVRLGRLAVYRAFKGKGQGSALLADALDRAVRAEIAARALMVDAKDDAAAFYQHHGFIALPDALMTLFLPLVAMQQRLERILVRWPVVFWGQSANRAHHTPTQRNAAPDCTAEGTKPHRLGERATTGGGWTGFKAAALTNRRRPKFLLQSSLI